MGLLIKKIMWKSKKLIPILVLFCLCSCGARKVVSSKMEHTDNSVIETNIKTTEKVTVNDKDQTTTTEETIEPIDNTKEAFYIDKSGNKQVLHNAKKRSVTTVKNNNTITNVEKADDVKQVEKKAIVTKSKDKFVDKKQFNPFMLLWLIIPLGIIYWAYTKYKNIPFVPKL